MTYQRIKKSATEESSQVATTTTNNDKATIENEERKIKNKMKLLNNENTFENRECQETLASNNRSKSSIRNDVKQTSDSKAFGEMYQYIKSDSFTLDTHNQSQIASFYKGRSVFITGASGFVGKVCIIK